MDGEWAPGFQTIILQSANSRDSRDLYAWWISLGFLCNWNALSRMRYYSVVLFTILFLYISFCLLRALQQAAYYLFVCWISFPFDNNNCSNCPILYNIYGYWILIETITIIVCGFGSIDLTFKFAPNYAVEWSSSTLDRLSQNYVQTRTACCSFISIIYLLVNTHSGMNMLWQVVQL